MSKALIWVTALFFVGAIGEFTKQDPEIHRVPGQPVTIEAVLARMSTSYMLKHAPEAAQCMYVVFSAVPLGLAYLWRTFDRRLAPRPKAARFFGALLFLLGSSFAGLMPAHSVIMPDRAGEGWSGIVPAFAFAAIFLAASWPLCFRLRKVVVYPQVPQAGPEQVG